MIKGRQDLKRAYQDERVARDYVAERFLTPLGALLHDRQVSVLRGILAGGGHVRRAVEIAPGPARLTVDIAPSLGRVTVVDASDEMLREARRRLQSAGVTTPVDYVRGDAFDLPVGGPTDLVYTFRLIRHFGERDRRRLYAEVARILAPGGWFVFDAVNAIVSEPLRARSGEEAHQHFDALLRADEVRAELTSCGFSDITLHGAQHRFGALYWTQVTIAPRSDRLARAVMAVLDRSGGQPLEWVVACRRA
jgi:SAM-dependent methyltransferase